MSTAPMTFPGDDDELATNLASHDWEISARYFQDYPTDTRCSSCGCKVGGPTAGWPCGTRPPRVEIEAGWWR